MSSPVNGARERITVSEPDENGIMDVVREPRDDNEFKQECDDLSIYMKACLVLFDPSHTHFNLFESGKAVTYEKPTFTAKDYKNSIYNSKLKGTYCRISAEMLEAIQGYGWGAVIWLKRGRSQIDYEYDEYVKTTGCERHAPFTDTKRPFLNPFTKKELEARRNLQNQELEKVAQYWRDTGAFKKVIVAKTKELIEQGLYPEHAVCEHRIYLIYKKVVFMDPSAPFYSTSISLNGGGRILSEQELREMYDAENQYWFVKGIKKIYSKIKEQLPPSPFSDIGWRMREVNEEDLVRASEQEENRSIHPTHSRDFFFRTMTKTKEVLVAFLLSIWNFLSGFFISKHNT